MVKHTQTIRQLLSTNCLGVFDHSVGLAFKGLVSILVVIISYYINIFQCNYIQVNIHKESSPNFEEKYVIPCAIRYHL